MAKDETTPEPRILKAHSFNQDLDVLAWKDISENIAPQGINLETKELIDQEFILHRAKQFPSRFPGQDIAYYVVGTTVKGNTLFNTVLGGGQPQEVLDAILHEGMENPVKFKLRFIEGGQYGGYYILE